MYIVYSDVINDVTNSGRNTILYVKSLAAVGFEPTPFRTGALNQRLRPLGHATDVISSFMQTQISLNHTA